MYFISAKDGLRKVYERGIVTHFVKPQAEIPRFSSVLDDLLFQKKEGAGKRHYIDAIDEIHSGLLNYMQFKKLVESNFIDESFVSFFSELCAAAIETFKVSDKSGLYAWATTRDKLRDRIKLTRNNIEGGITGDGIRDLIEEILD